MCSWGIEDDVPDCEDNEIQQLTEEYDFSMVVEELDPAFDGNLLFTTYLFLKRNMELAGVSSNDGYFEQFIKAIQDDYGFLEVNMERNFGLQNGIMQIFRMWFHMLEVQKIYLAYMVILFGKVM